MCIVLKRGTLSGIEEKTRIAYFDPGGEAMLGNEAFRGVIFNNQDDSNITC